MKNNEKKDLPSLCLGSAQFGLNYGITNKEGKSSLKEIKEIINYAKQSKIKYIDTAKAYGCAEKVLGKSIKDYKEFKIISKFPKQINQEWTLNSLSNWDDLLFSSLKDLKIKKLYGYLIHNLEDLRNPNFDLLLNWLLTKKRNGIVDKIGVSIYQSHDLKNLPLENIDIVQLPISIFDQRLIENGTIQNLIDKDITIHARSIFLQGLLLNREINTKNFSKNFIEHHKKFHSEIEKNNTTPLNEIFKFTKNLKGIDCIIIGVNTLSELKEIVHVWNNLNYKKNLTNNFSWHHEKDIDPRLWK